MKLIRDLMNFKAKKITFQASRECFRSRGCWCECDDNIRTHTQKMCDINCLKNSMI